MKIANASIIAACPPICVGAYPKVLIASDSTTATYDGGPIQGWGAYIGSYLNLSIMNLAKPGRSTRSFISEGLWAGLLKLAEPGDFVIIEMGHNDEGDPTSKNNTRAYRNTLPGTGAEIVTFYNATSRRNETVHTFGWYLKQMIIDVRDKQAVPIISGMTPRNNWSPKNSTDARLASQYKFRDYAKSVADELITDFVDHTTYGIKGLQDLGFADAKKMFPLDNTHTNEKGAQLFAESFVTAARCAGSEIAGYLNSDGRAVEGYC